MPLARLMAEVHRTRGNLKIEIVWKGEGERTPAPGSEPPFPNSGVSLAQKRIRIDGIVRRALDLIGQVNVVLFTPQDVDLITGAPALRRRYLDIVNSQVDSHYLRSLQHYHHILLQRNHLLKLIQAQKGKVDHLEFWDKELAEAGSYLVIQRQQVIAELDSQSRAIHQELVAGQERLDLAYLPNTGRENQDGQALITQFRQALEQARAKEIAWGMTLTGPHRDEFRFLVNGVDMGVYGSRGQQRTIALSLKLAEVRFIRARTGEFPILLLDEVLSELDRERRFYLQKFLLSCEQVLITTTDLDRFEPFLLTQASCFQVKQGQVEQA